MTNSVAESPDTQYRQCSTCGFATPATRTRCHHCWNRLSEAAPLLDQEQATTLISRQETLLANRASAQTWRERRRLVILGVIGALVLGWFGWWFYGAYIYEPPPVPMPSNTTVQMLSGSDVWATSGGDLTGARFTPVSAPLDGTEAWSTQLDGTPSTSLVADTERIYAVLANDRLVAVDRGDGAIAWTYDFRGSPFSAPTLVEERLYIGLRAGQLLVLDAETGDEVFSSLNTGVGFGASPIVLDGVVYMFGRGELVGMDASTGEVLWTTPNRDRTVFVNPVVTDRHIAGITGDEVLVFDRENASQTYFYPFSRFPYALSAADGNIYASASVYTVAFDEDSRRPWWEYWRATWNQFWIWGVAPDVPPPPTVWQYNTPPVEGYPSVLAGDQLVLAGEAEVVSLNRADGSVTWRHEGGPITAAPLGTSDGILVAYADRLVLYDTATGTALGERPLDAPLDDLIVVDGGLYAVTKTGELNAIR